jgi:SAM-dependent methyltransferase
MRRVMAALLYVLVTNIERLDTRAAGPIVRPTGLLSGAFTRFALEYAAQHQDRKLMVLQAGCATAGSELDLAAIRSAAPDVAICFLDDDSPAVRSALANKPDLDSATLGDLRSVPLAQRAFDIVHCAMLLERIRNAELVLDRLVSAIRPGGLLLLSTTDGQTAAGFLDRRMPHFMRSAAWRVTKSGAPGPFPAVFEPIASASGLHAYMIRHGLSVAHREARSTADGEAAAPSAQGARKLVASLSRGRLGDDHDELHYVIRKPQDADLRVL